MMARQALQRGRRGLRWRIRNAVLLAAVATGALGGCGGSEPNVGIYADHSGSGVVVVLQNDETQAIQLERLVLNGRENDSACSVNLFRPLGPGSRTEVPVTGCGDLIRIELHTDRGVVHGSMTQVQRDVSFLITGQVGSRATKILNGGSTPVAVRTLTVNNQPNNPACNFQVNQTVAPNGEIAISTDTCGEIDAVAVETDQGRVSKRRRPGPAPCGPRRRPCRSWTSSTPSIDGRSNIVSSRMPRGSSAGRGRRSCARSPSWRPRQRVVGEARARRPPCRTASDIA
jgi:hypothetical protein